MPALRVGQQVVIDRGIFEGIQGCIISLDEGWVTLRFLDVEVDVRINADLLRTVDEGPAASEATTAAEAAGPDDLGRCPDTGEAS